MEQIKGKHVLVAGATGGIGMQLVKLLAGSGANLFVTGRNREKLTALENDFNIKPSQVFAVDLTNANEVEQMAASIHASVPQIDILINVSGIGIIKSMDSLSIDDFTRTVQTNLFASFYLVKALLPRMKESKKGLIVNVPGVLGKVPMAGAAAYSASKYGLVGMMQSIREELKRTDIRITNLFLGGVDSPFWDNIDLRVQREKMIQELEAARAIWFLCQQPLSGVVSEMVLQPFNHQAI